MTSLSINQIITHVGRSIEDLERIQENSESQVSSSHELDVRIQEIVNTCIEKIQNCSDLLSSKAEIEKDIERRVNYIKSESRGISRQALLLNLALSTVYENLKNTFSGAVVSQERSQQTFVTPFQSSFNRLIDKLEMLDKENPIAKCEELLGLIEDFQSLIKRQKIEQLKKELEELSTIFSQCICGMGFDVRNFEIICNNLKKQNAEVNNPNNFSVNSPAIPIAVATPITVATSIRQEPILGDIKLRIQLFLIRLDQLLDTNILKVYDTIKIQPENFGQECQDLLSAIEEIREQVGGFKDIPECLKQLEEKIYLILDANDGFNQIEAFMKVRQDLIIKLDRISTKIPGSVAPKEAPQVRFAKSSEAEIIGILKNDMLRYIGSLNELELKNLNELMAKIRQNVRQLYDQLQFFGEPAKTEVFIAKFPSLQAHPKETAADKAKRKSYAILNHIEKLSCGLLPINNTISSELLIIQSETHACQSIINAALTKLQNRKIVSSTSTSSASTVTSTRPTKVAAKIAMSTTRVVGSHERVIISSFSTVPAYITQLTNRSEIAEIREVLLQMRKEFPKLIEYVDRIPKNTAMTGVSLVSLPTLPSQVDLIAMSTIARLHYVRRYLCDLGNFKMRSGKELAVLLDDLNDLDTVIKTTLIIVEGRGKELQAAVVS